MLKHHQNERIQKKSHLNAIKCVHQHRECCHCYYHQKCITFTSIFFIHLFIVSTIMASTSDHTVVDEMNILNDQLNGVDGSQVVLLPALNQHQIVLNELLPPSQKATARGRSISMPLVSKSNRLLTKHVAASALTIDHSTNVQESSSSTLCNCLNRKTLVKLRAFGCMQICARQQQYSKKFKRKHKLNNRKIVQKREHLTLIHGFNAVSNSTQQLNEYSKKCPIQSDERVVWAKFKRKPLHRHTTYTTTIDEKSLNNSTHETNKLNQISASTTNLHEMTSYSDNHLRTLQNMDFKNNRQKSSAVTQISNNDKDITSMMFKYESIELNGGWNGKRKIRSIAKVTVTPTPTDAINMTKSILSATTKDSNNVKSTQNGIIDSSIPRGGVTEIIGFDGGTSSGDDSDAIIANPTIASSTRTFGDTTTNDYVNYASDDTDMTVNMASNLLQSDQYLDLTIKPDADEELQSTQLPIIDKSNETACISIEANTNNTNNITIICDQGNDTCVGNPDWCNLTYEEYREMLDQYIWPTPGEWVLVGFHTLVFAVGSIGNILVCIAVYANTSMRTITNIFIVNLAIADLLVIILCLPTTVLWDITETWFFGEAMCKVILYLQTVSVTVSVLTLTFISIDRWYAICFPLRYVSTNGRAWCSVGVIWIAALVSDLPEFINSRTKKTELRFNIDLFTQCVSTWDKNTEKNVVIARFVLLYLAPLFFMSIAYFKIIRVLWKSDTIPGHRESCNHRQMHTVHSRNTVANSSTLSQLRARRKAAKMLVVVVLMFAICYLPVHTLNIVRYTIEQEQTTIVAILSLISHWLCYANSAVNPLIYNFMSGKFRREFVSALERCRCSNRDVYRHHSCYFNPTGGRLNTISPNTRSLCQFSSHRDRNKSFREKH
ncbi:uncharacterized protein LOC116340015 isoform X2 [Contarinia nasturtii]|nr:uncharacterized protein LOC116340015 isoform X2 [Contarinia nasturtii]